MFDYFIAISHALFNVESNRFRLWHYACMPRYNSHKHTCSFQLYLSLSDDSDAGWRQAGQIADLNSHADLVMLQRSAQLCNGLTPPVLHM